MNKIKFLKERSFNSIRSIRGITLIVGLIFMALTLLISSALVVSSNSSVRSTGDWVDRQKSINTADAAIKTAIEQIEAKVDNAILQNIPLETAFNDPSEGFYVRGLAGVQDWDPWPASLPRRVATDPAIQNTEYFVVYEGQNPLNIFGDELQINDPSSTTRWFSIFAKANGMRSGTEVILYAFKDVNMIGQP